MDEKNTFRLDETILKNRKKYEEDPEIIIDMDGSQVVGVNDSHSEPYPDHGDSHDTLHIEIGELDYDPEEGQWKDSSDGWRVPDREEKEADYRQVPDHESLGAKALTDRHAGKAKPKKEMPFYLQVAYGLLALACLAFCFIYPYHYLNNMIAQASEVTAASEEAVKTVPGTYCTLKSNSLDGVPVYANAGDTAQIAFIPEGKYVELVDSCAVDGKDWARIDYCGINAWIPLKQLHFINEGDSYIQVGSRIYMNSITEKGINLYARPSAQADVVASGILYGTEFTVLELEEGWARVDYQDKSCWVNMYHMGSYGSRHWKVETLSKAQAVNFRKEPDAEAGLYGKIPENQKLTIKEFQDGWGQVDYDGNSGWVMLHYLIPVEGE